MGLMGLEMMEFLADFRHRHNSTIEMRIGIDVGGPVVAGVIGRRKFAYDLWGGPASIAEKYESSGVAGRVHVSRRALGRMRGVFEVEPRGPCLIGGVECDDSVLLVGLASPGFVSPPSGTAIDETSFVTSMFGEVVGGVARRVGQTVSGAFNAVVGAAADGASPGKASRRQPR